MGGGGLSMNSTAYEIKFSSQKYKLTISFSGMKIAHFHEDIQPVYALDFPNRGMVYVMFVRHYIKYGILLRGNPHITSYFRPSSMLSGLLVL